MTSFPLLDSGCLAPIRSAGGCLLGVSGGADSVALLHALHEWAAACEQPPRLEVIHVNHQLRGADADQDQEFVRRLCDGLRLVLHVRRTPPPSERPTGRTLEEFLRVQRHSCFAEVLGRAGLTVLATGHTADDLAETFLMHLMRGAGLRGLTFNGVEQAGDYCLTRPLWRSTRNDVLQFLKHRGVTHREDVTNASVEFTRNRVRHVLLPLMEREFNPSVRGALVRSAMALSRAEVYVRKEVKARLQELQASSGDEAVLPRKKFLAAEAFIQTELVGEWLRTVTGGAARPDSIQIEQVLTAAARARGRVAVPVGAMIVATEEALLLVCGAAGTEHSRGAMDPVSVALATRYLLSHPGQPLAALQQPARLTLSSPDEESTAHLSLLDGSELPVRIRWLIRESGTGPRHLEVRNRRPGDWISRGVKLKSVLINDKVPWFVRDLLIVVADDAGQVWHVAGMNRINARISGRWGQTPPISVSYQSLKSSPD